MIHCAHLIYVDIIEYIMKSLLYFQIISYNISFFNVNIDSTLNVITGKTLMHLHIHMSSITDDGNRRLPKHLEGSVSLWACISEQPKHESS